MGPIANMRIKLYIVKVARLKQLALEVSFSIIHNEGQKSLRKNLLPIALMLSIH